MIIKFFQQNAEWLCAIAITIFAGVQCLLAFQQSRQNIKFKRLELANELDKICNDFLGDRDEAIKIRFGSG